VANRAGVNAVARRKIPSPCLELNPGHPAHSLVAILTELPQLPEMYGMCKILELNDDCSIVMMKHSYTMKFISCLCTEWESLVQNCNNYLPKEWHMAWCTC
jgi:hypothetical protein